MCCQVLRQVALPQGRLKDFKLLLLQSWIALPSVPGVMVMSCMAAEVSTTSYMLRPVYDRLPAIKMHNTSPQPVPVASHISSYKRILFRFFIFHRTGLIISAIYVNQQPPPGHPVWDFSDTGAPGTFLKGLASKSVKQAGYRFPSSALKPCPLP
ncbi:hypothetical protein B0H19DRAFT_1067768 [Mycena capillaripes]|nr:hypothetical protein B0H19DRAFT_1067768 [Mycena capillaripes]